MNWLGYLKAALLLACSAVLANDQRIGHPTIAGGIAAAIVGFFGVQHAAATAKKNGP
jgi:hypothetical protein